MSAARGRLQWLRPLWPAPAAVRAAMSLRGGGVSRAPYDSLNLAMHVGDEPQLVAHNRRLLREALQLPGEPRWLQQVHGSQVVEAGAQLAAGPAPRADACHARQAGQVCAVLTADCLPVLFTDRAGSQVAAAHAGWRGLAAGVLEATLAALDARPAELLVWLGPGIGPAAFEVAEPVRAAFLARDVLHEAAFVPNARGRWQADLAALARRELQRLGVAAIFSGARVESPAAVRQAQLRAASGHGRAARHACEPAAAQAPGHKDGAPRAAGACVHDDAGASGFCCHDDARFFSYRRDGRTGRMATMIWRQP